jgi:hypothetical protein
MQTYPIQTGPSAPLTTFILASELGCALNCDLLTGLDKTSGLPAADDAPLINAALAPATAANPICLIMDGSSAVSGVRGPSAGHWSIVGFGPDTGFFIASGANFHGISNVSTLAVAVNGPAPGRGSNVAIRDLTINGNVGGNSTTGDPRGGNTSGVSWYFNLYLKSLNGIEIRNVNSIDSPAFQCVLENCGHWIVDGCNFNSTTGNTDGIHVNGPSNNGIVANCSFLCGDDPIALNSCEGYGGLIAQIAIDNCISNSQTLGRIYTESRTATGGGAQPAVDGVTWSNYQAFAYAGGLILGVNGAQGSVADSITNVTFDNCKLSSSTYFVQISDSIGSLTFNACDFIYGNAACLIQGVASPVQVSALNLTNCRALQNQPGLTSIVGSSTGTAFKRVAINGFAVIPMYGYGGGSITGLISLAGSLSQLQIDAIDASNIASLIASGNAPASVAGAAVLQTGWPIADSAMARWTPYVSATSGVPSYRNAAGAAVAL